MSAIASRDRLVDAIQEFLAERDLLTAAEIRAELEREIDSAGADALVKLKERLTLDRGWDYYPPDPLARRIHHLLADRFLRDESRVEGADRLPAGAQTIIVANHLSYADANVVEVLLSRAGYGHVADRLTALAGPKVFSDRQRRFSSLCFGTVKVPQSTEVSSGEAVLSARDVARAARRAIDVACDRLRGGDVLLLFAEGTRSRTASMQPLLPAAARYLEVPGTWLVPAGLTGPETLFPIDGTTIQPAPVVLRIGTPIEADALLESVDGDRRLAMDAIGKAIAALLPPSYRGIYA
jgi:1-acyl-sn-glycerol-3-phosphate acyltransferase